DYYCLSYDSSLNTHVF
nr:immunoglobulin light chain junction region [Macaca mulatta]MOW04444.1 immunoglobulin light chain junction region [Macaca mulatta]MOW05817.1 immunoglobulin light chain junction region [Macaca mulatta]MOW06016.1 immunoglobulin light chain junction region [Macaca mulatta]MOW06574.1 immunoglobulin light chain junction region [Macaca mulatta]